MATKDTSALERDEETTAFTMRLPVELHEAVKRCAVSEDRTVAQTIRVALRDYLSEHAAS